MGRRGPEVITPPGAPPAVTDAWIVGVLTYAHILSAIGWLGSALTMNIALGPLMNRFAPGTRVDLLQHFVPRFGRMSAAFAGLTVLFGIGLYVSIFSGSSHLWFTVIGVGTALALVAFVLGAGIIIPAGNRLSAIARDMASQPPGPPPAEFAPLLRRLQVASLGAMLILVVVRGFMVTAAQI